MLRLKKYAGVKIISYSIITLSLMMLFAMPVMFLIAKSHNYNMQRFAFDFVILIFIAVFGLVSAKGYLKKKKWSRITLIYTCAFYLAVHGIGLIVFSRFNASIRWTSIVIVCICIYGIWYLLQPEGKEWVLTKN